MATKSVKLPAQMHPIQAVCATKDSRYEIASVYLEGDLAVATNGRMFAAVRGAVVEENPSQPFPPWRDVVPDPTGMRFIELDPTLLLKLARSLMRGDERGVIIGVPKNPNKAVLVLSTNKNRDALGVLMPICMGVAKCEHPQAWASETIGRVVTKKVKARSRSRNAKQEPSP